MGLIDPECINSIKELGKESGDDLLKSLLDIYIDQAPIALAAIKEAMQKGDLDTLRKEAHSLKSSSAALGVVKILEACSGLEKEITISTAPSLDKLNSYIEIFDKNLSQSLDELKKILAET
jgi:HPt (histidine-containing phosphotransfer) domain-containing protein